MESLWFQTSRGSVGDTALVDCHSQVTNAAMNVEVETDDIAH